jgi:phosphopantothenoylcysteine decarboxylase/phosphopantothenate--cysteine ligase
MAAAVSDFTPVEYVAHKVKKEARTNSLELKRTTDILAWLGARKSGHQCLIGFAMETENLLENATIKLSQKNADWIVANSLSEENSGFEGDYNRVTLIAHQVTEEFAGSKNEIAERVLNFIFNTN